MHPSSNPPFRSSGRLRRIGPVVFLSLVSCGTATKSAEESYQGVVEWDERNVAFELGGRIQSIEVIRGERVASGAKIAALDPTLETRMRDGRAAELEAANARLALLQAGARTSDVRSLAAQVAAAQAAETLIARNLRRAETLEGQDAIARAQVEDLTAQRDRAAAERRSIEERLRTMKAGARAQEIAAAEAQVAAAMQAVGLAEERLGRHVLSSPLGGTVLDVVADPGDVVAPGAPIAIVADDAHPYVDVFVPEARLATIRMGGAATIRIDASKASISGRIEDIGRRTEFTPRYLFSERERPNLVIRVRVRADDPQRSLRAGVPAFVTFAGSSR